MREERDTVGKAGAGSREVGVRVDGKDAAFSDRWNTWPRTGKLHVAELRGYAGDAVTAGHDARTSPCGGAASTAVTRSSSATASASASDERPVAALARQTSSHTSASERGVSERT